MAVKLISNYSKRLGLPGYSSHQFSVSIETEVHDVNDIAGESARLYQTLQQSVDAQMQQTGFVPPNGYGLNGEEQSRNGDDWQCSGKQREFIERIVRENGLDKDQVEQLSVELYGCGVKALNRLGASGFIDELLERYGGRKRNGRRDRQPASNGHDRAR